MQEPRQAEWIVRACQDRALIVENTDAATALHLHDTLLKQPVLFTKTIQMRGYKPLVKAGTRAR